jgi:hypothetical protein
VETLRHERIDMENTEQTPDRAQASGQEQTHRQTRTALAVTVVLRANEPENRAAHAERMLVRTVAEWEAGAGIDMLARSHPSGRITIELRPIGAAPLDWTHDVASALRHVADIARRTSRSPALGPTERVAELVRDPARVGFPEDGLRPVDGRVTGVTPMAWPRPTRDASVDLLQALRDTPGAFVRTLIASPSPIERSMLFEQMTSSWDRFTHPDLDGYLGSPVLMRTFVGLVGGATGFARIRAIVRGWGLGLALREVDELERARFGTMGALSVAGFVRPEGWALAMLRLPAAGEGPVLGIRSRFPSIDARPMQTATRRTAQSVVLGAARSATGGRVAVTLEPADLCRHVSVEGASGAGKTTFLTTLVAALSRQGIGCTVLEHHGSGIDQALRAMSPEAAARATVVRHGDSTSPAVVNLFDEADPGVREQVFAEFTELVQAMFDPRGEGIVGPRWRRWFTLLCDGVAAAFGSEATLLHVLAVASDPDRARALAVAAASTDADLARRILDEIASLKGDEATNLPAWAVSKFQPLVGQRAMRAIIGRPRDSVDVSRLMDEGGTLLVDLGGPVLGTGAARMLGATWLLKHWVAMGRRRDRTKPHYIIVDEAHLLTFGALPNLLAEARKFGVGVIIAGQTSEAYSPALQSAIDANVGTFITFRQGLNTAGRASARLDGWPAHELLRLPDLNAAATVSRGGVTSEPFLLTVTRPDTDSEAARQQAERADARCSAQWRALAAGPVTTDAEVDRQLSRLAKRDRPARRQAPRPGSSPSARTADAGFLPAPEPFDDLTAPAPADSAGPTLEDWLTRP